MTLSADILRAAADPQNDLDWETVTIALGFGMGLLVLVTILIVVVVREVGQSRRARAAVAREEEYKKLAERHDTFTASAATQLERHAADMAEIRRRLGEIETVLRTVE